MVLAAPLMGGFASQGLTTAFGPGFDLLVQIITDKFSVATCHCIWTTARQLCLHWLALKDHRKPFLPHHNIRAVLDLGGAIAPSLGRSGAARDASDPGGACEPPKRPRTNGSTDHLRSCCGGYLAPNPTRKTYVQVLYRFCTASVRPNPAQITSVSASPAPPVPGSAR